MTLINMCNNCPHNPVKHESDGGKVLSDWLLQNTISIRSNLEKIYNDESYFPRDTSGETSQKEKIGSYITYKNRNLLKTISQIPVEYRPIFKSMFDELTKQIVEAKLMSFTDGESKIPPQQSCKERINVDCFL